MRKKSSSIKWLWVSVLALAFVSLTAEDSRKAELLDPETPVADLLAKFGHKPIHYMENPDPVMVEKGRQIVFEGQTTGPDGKRTRRVSNYFYCTHCHNTVMEDPDLTKSDPEARLDFIIAQNKPFLPASTFYGLVNRTTFYNGDYQKKYGKLVVPAHDTLANAIQLCATECSQGRRMEKWEIDAVIAYYHSIGFKLKDLQLSEEEKGKLFSAINADSRDFSKEVKELLHSKFYTASPATFVNPGDKSIRKYGEGGNPDNGRKIYVHGCMSCHKPVGGVTNFVLDMEKVTFRALKRNLKKNNHFSAYYMVRKGTYAVPGYRPYMPNYSLERLSASQMEDLIAFINQQAK